MSTQKEWGNSAFTWFQQQRVVPGITGSGVTWSNLLLQQDKLWDQTWPLRDCSSWVLTTFREGDCTSLDSLFCYPTVLMGEKFYLTIQSETLTFHLCIFISRSLSLHHCEGSGSTSSMTPHRHCGGLVRVPETISVPGWPSPVSSASHHGKNAPTATALGALHELPPVCPCLSCIVGSKTGCRI